MTSEIRVFINFLMGLLVFSCILFLAYVFTRFIGKKTSLAMKGKHMHVVESISLGIDKTIYLIRIDKKYILLATAGKTVQFISDLDLQLDEDVLAKNEERSNIVGNFNFEKHLRKFLKDGVFSSFNRTQAKDVRTMSQDNNMSQNIERLKSSLNKLKDSDRSREGKDHE